MISQIFDSDSFKVMSLFALSPGSRFRRKEIQEKTKINNVPLDKSLSRLLSSGILLRERNLYSVNHENIYADQAIGIASSQYKQLKGIPFSVYLLLLDAISGLSLSKGIEAWLFGSYSKLVYTEKSDVDIAIIIPKGFSKKAIETAIRKLEKQHSKKIETHFFDSGGFYKNKKDPIVKDILRNGIRLL